MEKRPVLAFYLLTILISWIGWEPVVLGSRGVAFFQSPRLPGALAFARHRPDAGGGDRHAPHQGKGGRQRAGAVVYAGTSDASREKLAGGRT